MCQTPFYIIKDDVLLYKVLNNASSVSLFYWHVRNSLLNECTSKTIKEMLCTKHTYMIIVKSTSFVLFIGHEINTLFLVGKFNLNDLNIVNKNNIMRK